MANPTPEQQVSRIAVKLPCIWRQNIKLWFLQVESNFLIAGITHDVTKFNTLIASIDSDTLSAVSDILFHPPEVGKYEALKARLIAEFSESENRQIQKLLSELQLGDNKPSVLLRQMRELAGTQVSDDFLRNLWMQRLTSTTQTILSVSSEPLDNLAKLADKIAEVQPEPVAVMEMASVPPANESDAIMELKSEILALSRQVEKLWKHRTSFAPDEQRHSSASNAHSNAFRKRSTSPRRSNDTTLCYYHRRFGKSARKCQEPCNFPKASEN